MIAKIRPALWAGMAALLTAGCGGSDAPGDGSNADASPARIANVTIGSNPAGTHVYAVAAGLAKVLQESDAIRAATMRPFSGSSVYLPMLHRGEITLGLNTSIDSYLSYQGRPPYSERLDNLRAVGAMFPLPIMYIVRADSGMTRIEDLRGKRVVIDYRAMAALNQLHTAILATGGLTPADVEPVVVAGLPEGIRMLTEGRADAVPTGIDTALALQAHSSIPGGIRYVTMGADEDRLAEGMPGALPVTAEPASASAGIDAPTRVAGVLDYLNSSTHVSPDTVYEIIKAIHQNWSALQRDYPQLRELSADEIAPATHLHPYHEGAVRYYREAGLWSEAHEQNQARLLALD